MNSTQMISPDTFEALQGAAAYASGFGGGGNGRSGGGGGGGGGGRSGGGGGGGRAGGGGRRGGGGGGGRGGGGFGGGGRFGGGGGGGRGRGRSSASRNDNVRSETDGPPSATSGRGGRTGGRPGGGGVRGGPPGRTGSLGRGPGLGRSVAQPRAPVRPKGPVELPSLMTVREFSEATGVGASDILKALLKLGVLANINQQIDYDTAALIATDFNIETTEYVPRQLAGIVDNVKDVLLAESSGDLKPRPPVVTIMGHVDHGKTKLLDAIRSAQVAEGEAGGITQHIGAYQVEVHGRKITFLDTPGHEAFTAMRARGAQVTDIVILVVAADDGVMPQTQEAIAHVQAAGVPLIVAINKIDREQSNPERVMQQLSEQGLIPTQWNGDTEMVQVSALQNLVVDALLDQILLQAELLDRKG